MLPTQEFTETGVVETFPPPAAWLYVRMPEIYSEMIRGLRLRGFVPIMARVGDTTWRTSLLPLGKGQHFIALKAEVRKAEGIKLGDTITIHFTFRI